MSTETEKVMVARAVNLATIQLALDQVGCGAYWLAMADYDQSVPRIAVDRVGQRAVLYAQRIVEVTSDQLVDALTHGRQMALMGRRPLTARATAQEWMEFVRTPGVTL